MPPAEQRVPATLADSLFRRLGELTVNVSVRPKVRVAENGREFIELMVDRSASVASSTEGRGIS